MQEFLLLKNGEGIDLDGKSFLLEGSLSHYLKQLCFDFGSSLDGRKEAMQHFYPGKRKLPLVISHSFGLSLLCTRAINASDLIVVNFNRLLMMKRYKGGTCLYFVGDITIEVDVDIRILRRQEALLKAYLKNYHQKHILLSQKDGKVV